MNSDSESSDVDEHGQHFGEDNTQVLVGIDCSESMFEPLEAQAGLTGIQVALQAVHNVYDELLLSKTAKNKLAVAFFHEDPDKMFLIDFDTPVIGLLKTLKELAYSAEKLKPYKSNGSKFSRFLIECRKKFKQVNKNDFKYFLYVSTNGNPCRGDAKESFVALREFRDFKELGFAFKLTPLIEEFDYELFFAEAYKSVNEDKPKHFYDLECLTDFIKSKIKFKSLHTNMKLHLNVSTDVPQFIPCVARKYNKNANLLPNKTMTRDLQSEAHRTTERSLDEETFDLQLREILSGRELIINKDQKDGLQSTPQIKQGLTIIHASEKRYSDLGLNLKTPALIRPKNPNDRTFLHLWEACVKNELYLLCYLKYKQVGKVHSAELVPQMVNFQKQFLVTVIPNTVQLQEPEFPSSKIQYDNATLDVFNKFVNEATIINYDITKVRPYVYNRQVKYFKKELLGNDYVDKDEYTDFVEGAAFQGDVEGATQELYSLFPAVLKGAEKRGRGQSTRGSKRGRK